MLLGRPELQHPSSTGKPGLQRGFWGWTEEGVWAGKEPAAATRPWDLGVHLLVPEAVSAVWVALRWTMWVKVVTMTRLCPNSPPSSSGRGKRGHEMIVMGTTIMGCYSKWKQAFSVPLSRRDLRSQSRTTNGSDNLLYPDKDDTFLRKVSAVWRSVRWRAGVMPWCGVGLA